MTVNGFVTTVSLLFAALSIWSHVWFNIHLSYEQSAKPTLTSRHALLMLGISLTGLGMAFVFSVFGALADWGNAFPYAIGFLGFTVSSVVFFSAAGLPGFVKRFAGSVPFGQPYLPFVKHMQKFWGDQWESRYLQLWVAFVVTMLILWLTTVPLLTNWTLKP